MKTENADSVERFSNRAGNYAKYRPGYPHDILSFFKDIGLTLEWMIADVGSGTGFSARPFLENGNVVYGVEPNAAMRAAAERYLDAFDNFRSVNGTSDRTTLEDGSIDLVIAAQAFHWFEPESTRREFKRILKPGGYAALIWNERQLDATPFLREYEELLIRYSNDYSQVRHENIDREKIGEFFGQPFETRTFANQQIFDFDGLKGRVLSSSYMPSETHAAYEPMIEELQTLFAKHASSGKITILYDTKVHLTQI